MASSNEEVKFDFDNIHPVDLRLQSSIEIQ